jgi:hypothetical protein
MPRSCQTVVKKGSFDSFPWLPTYIAMLRSLLLQGAADEETRGLTGSGQVRHYVY